MSAASPPQNLEIDPAGVPTMFDSLARLVPDDLQAAYYRVLAHTRTLSPDDEMLRILEAMGILALLTRHTPKDIADERERLQELLEAHEHFSDEAQQKMLDYVHELESRIADLPGKIEAGLDPKQIARMLGESLRQHFRRSGVLDALSALQTTSAAMTGAQKELSTALQALSDSHGGVVAQVERANNRIEYSLESRAKTFDTLLHEWNSDLLRIWIPMVAAASMLIGLFGGMEIQGCRDSASPPATIPTQSAVPTVPNLPPNANDSAVAPNPCHFHVSLLRVALTDETFPRRRVLPHA
jgi:predicted  nucleic acid-binding Zn-ribbon protein